MISIIERPRAVNDYQQEALIPGVEIINSRQGWLKVSKSLKVPYTKENIGRCMCPECPVLAGSECAGKKLKSLRDEISHLEKGDVQEPENIWRVHYSNGITTCRDLDTAQPCICNVCAVWQEYRLAIGNPAGYFCKNGRAR